jgi:hypothetical protein
MVRVSSTERGLSFSFWTALTFSDLFQFSPPSTPLPNVFDTGIYIDTSTLKLLQLRLERAESLVFHLSSLACRLSGTLIGR